MDTLRRLQEIFREIFDDESLVLKRETTADDIEEWDSLAQVNIIVACEGEFGVKFDLGDVARLKRVGDIVNFVEGNK